MRWESSHLTFGLQYNLAMFVANLALIYLIGIASGLNRNMTEKDVQDIFAGNCVAVYLSFLFFLHQWSK